MAYGYREWGSDMAYEATGLLAGSEFRNKIS